MIAVAVEKPRAARKATPKPASPGATKMRQLSKILWDASQWDGDFSSGYSLRLLRIASGVALDVADEFDALDPAHQVCRAFDVAAVVSAARRVPKDQPMPFGLLELIASAHSLLNDLTDCDDCFDDGPVTPEASAAPFLNGYTPAQLRDILGHISCSTNAAAEVLMDIEARIDGLEWTPSQCTTTLHVATQAVRLIGAVADQACGNPIYGGPLEWSMGGKP